MYNILFSLVFGSIFYRTTALNCPSGSFTTSDENVCIFAVSETEFYLDVSRRCSSLGGVPAKIQNAFENANLLSLVGSVLNNVPAYIGVERKKGDVWMYADGTPLLYQNWAFNEPSIWSNSSACAVIDPQSGKWLSAECYVARPFFCTVMADDSQCPLGWSYFQGADSCYYVEDFTYSNEGLWNLYDVTTAEQNCLQMNSHLVSIHSDNEMEFVYNLAYSSAQNLSNAAPVGQSCGYQWAWIGLNGTGSLGQGTWTDWSPVDWLPSDLPAFSDYDDWAISNDRSCDLRGWYNLDDPTNVLARFVCKTPSKSRSTKNVYSKKKKN